MSRDNIFPKKTYQQPLPLRIDGLGEAPMTPEPDDAELAAQAILEHMMHGRQKKDTRPEPAEMTQEYYETMANRIRAAHTAAAIRTLRFLAYCEQQLQNPHLPATGSGSLTLLEVELYKRIDTVEREGGELKRRWQRCLADVTVRLMQIYKTDTEA